MSSLCLFVYMFPILVYVPHGHVSLSFVFLRNVCRLYLLSADIRVVESELKFKVGSHVIDLSVHDVC